MKGEPFTSISTFDETSATIRGKDLVNEIIGEISYTKMIYFYILGKEPTDAQVRILDAVLVTLMDHGVVGALNARMAYRAAPESIQGAIAAGLLNIGSQFGGVMEQVGKQLETIVAAPDHTAAARSIVESFVSRKRPLPGFGHNHFKPEDPRSAKLIEVARRNGHAGAYLNALLTLSKELDQALGKHITINATAAMAALLAEIGMPTSIMRGFAAISRAPGLLGHILEEQRQPAANHIAEALQTIVPYKPA